jgi:hypothetical protein
MDIVPEAQVGPGADRVAHADDQSCGQLGSADHIVTQIIAGNRFLTRI